MGDVIHVLPAITDAKSARPDIDFDFVVEESFQEIPAWHVGVQHVIPVASRRWRNSVVSSREQIFSAFHQVREKNYDVIIDAQGLGKSALISMLAKGQRHGFDKRSIRESFASYFYNQGHSVDKSTHAIYRTRSLFAKALGYEFDSEQLDYGLSVSDFSDVNKPLDVLKLLNLVDSFYVFLHGTTWLAKEWPEKNWIELAEKITSQGDQIVLPWGNEKERLRAQRITEGIDNAYVLPRMNISDLGLLISDSKGVVAVDTGLGHLSAALGRPTVSIYGPTDTSLIGTQGDNQVHLCSVESPQWSVIKKNQAFDYGKITADLVINELQTLINV
jgi:heptosyltransferase-1